MKAIVGMSGGVDSSVAAYLLKKAGHEVHGLSLLMFDSRGTPGPASCCSLQAINEAAETASAIGITHSMINARDLFFDKVVTPFIESYKTGLTPNPCILCNIHVKFPLLLDECLKTGADIISTGHYARVEGGKLYNAADMKKDQSYVLYGMKKEELARLALPLGTMMKTEVREIARSIGLPVFNRPESQEICFTGGGDYSSFLRRLDPECMSPGPIVDDKGRTLGTHRGLYSYTLGQRKGLGVSSPYPLYVTGIDISKNILFVGPRDSALMRKFEVSDINWLEPMRESSRATVKVRSTMPAEPASISASKGNATVTFDKPQWTSAPGQSAVFYDGGLVLGGGTIASVGTGPAPSSTYAVHGREGQ